MITRRTFVSGSAALATGALAPGFAFAQSDYPNQPVRCICMFPPGTGADVLVRFFANKLSKLTGKNFIVENRAGAFGNIATEYVARAKSDGYTVYIAPGSSVFAAAAHLFKKLNFDPVNDFEHISTFAKLSFILMVSSSSPFKTVADLTEYLKAQGDKASYGSIANTGLVASELYKAGFGLKTVEVKYKDPGAMANDLLNGQTSFVHIDPITFAAHVKEGRMRPLCIAAGERLKALPDIPSAKEAGIPNCDLTAWWSVHTPKGVPQPILSKLEQWINEVVKDPETVQFLANTGNDPFPNNQQGLRDLLAREIQAWEGYVKLANIEKL